MTEEFERVRKKYNLPSFEALDVTLDLSGHEEAENVLRWLIKRVSERLEFYSDFMGNLVQPDGQPSNLYELNAFSDGEREKLSLIFKKLMFLHREYLVEELNFKEDSAARYLLHFMKEWEMLKKELTEVLEVLKKSWQDESRLRLNLEYYG
ncbi:MAG TPA: hypothetical protein VJG90_01010 [Candidatus Nanoarchaeia archaeon]|nr:hypothetical protein [Candidatus Nanoarchaeia archaeon]